MEHRGWSGSVRSRMIMATSGLHAAPVSATEHRSSTELSTLDKQTILLIICAGQGPVPGAPPGTRTPNPRIKRPKFTHSQDDYLRPSLALEAPNRHRWQEPMRVAGQPHGQQVHSGRSTTEERRTRILPPETHHPAVVRISRGISRPGPRPESGAALATWVLSGEGTKIGGLGRRIIRASAGGQVGMARAALSGERSPFRVPAHTQIDRRCSRATTIACDSMTSPPPLSSFGNRQRQSRPRSAGFGGHLSCSGDSLIGRRDQATP
jgi:hypothetical protein